MKQIFTVEVDSYARDKSCTSWAIENAIKEIVKPDRVIVRWLKDEESKM